MPLMLGIGKKLSISIFTLPVLLCLAVSYDRVWLLTVLAAALLHELGHIAAMRLFGVPIVGVRIYPFGAEIVCNMSSCPYAAEAVCAGAGIGTSLALFAASALLFRFTGNAYAFTFGSANLALFALNVMPCADFDGMTVLRCVLLSKCKGAASAEKIGKALSLLSCASAAVICISAFILIALTGYNLSLLFIFIYVAVAKGMREPEL